MNVADRLRRASAAHERMAALGVDAIVAAGDAMVTALLAGRSVLAFGNGGNAADAQHFAAEEVGEMSCCQDTETRNHRNTETFLSVR